MRPKTKGVADVIILYWMILLLSPISSAKKPKSGLPDATGSHPILECRIELHTMITVAGERYELEITPGAGKPEPSHGLASEER